MPGGAIEAALYPTVCMLGAQPLMACDARVTSSMSAGSGTDGADHDMGGAAE